MKICFFMGYGVMFDHHEGGLAGDIYGSELALHKLAVQLAARGHDVCVTSMNLWPDRDFGPLRYVHNDTLRSMAFDVVIVWRFAHYFLHFADLAPRTYFWFHDTAALPWLEGVLLPDDAGPLLANVRDRVTGYVALTQFHKDLLVDKYGMEPSKVAVLGNAIEPPVAPVEPVVTRVRNRFIWVSAYARGLRRLVDFFPQILAHLPDAELHVFRKPDSDEDVEYLRARPYVTVRGFVTNDAVQAEMRRAEYWLYPTDFVETYCISALEAQRAGVICIATALGALTETVGDRGVLLRTRPVHSPEYWSEALQAVLRLAGDDDSKAALRQRAQDWACQQTWETRAAEWEELAGA